MRNCILDELLLVSFRQRAARRVRFHPATTLLIGANGTGKSSIIKSIYHAFGADPAVWSDQWKAAQVATVVRFRVDGEAYTVSRHAGEFTLYDRADRVIESFTSVTQGLGPALARLFGFDLLLPDRAGDHVTPPPAYLFLPFYVDQDASWQRPWSGFAGLGQLSRWQQPLAEYHTGLRPHDYYRVRAAVDRARRRIVDGHAKLNALRAVQDSIGDEMRGTLFQINADAFRLELQELLGEMRRLDRDERLYRMRLRDVQAQRTLVAEQRKATAQAMMEAQKDLAYATVLPGQAVECPACGAQYENSFAHRFAIAEDESRCRELSVELDGELRRLDTALEQAEKDFSDAVERRARLRALLSERRGELDMQDVIRAEGRAEVRRVFRAGGDALASEVRAAESEVEDGEQMLRRLSDPDRRGRVLQLYRDRLRAFLEQLDVAPSPALSGTSVRRPFARARTAAVYEEVVHRITETGSERPRAVLAYFYAVLHTMAAFSPSAFCPVVVDSPNQQAQDEINHETVLRFLFERRPPGAQLVVGLESGRDIPASVYADASVIELPAEPRRSVLEPRAYDEVAGIVGPLITGGFRLTTQD